MGKLTRRLGVGNLTREELFSMFWAIIIAFQSMFPWFFWNTLLLKGVFIIIFLISSINLLKRNLDMTMSLYMVVLALFTLLHAKFGEVDILSSFNRLVTMLPLFIFPLFSLEYKKAFLKILITIYALILGVSLLFFAAWMSGVYLPHTQIQNPNPFYPPFDNYYFFIVGVDMGIMTRFSSIFTEAGHVGMISALLLYLNGYSWRDWRNICMTIALIWAFSLAGYLLYVIGFILFTIAERKTAYQKIRTIVLTLMGIVAVIAVVGSLNRDIMDEKIFKRMEFSSSGGFEGDNRNNKYFDLVFDSLEVEDLLIGMDQDIYVQKGLDVDNSSYKNFILKDGVIGLVLIFIIFLLYLKRYPSRLGTAYFILLTLSFIQRPYILWEMESLPYMAAMTIFNYDQLHCHDKVPPKKRNKKSKRKRALRPQLTIADHHEQV